MLSLYVYLLAPLLFMAAVVIGWGPRRIPARAFAFMAAIVVAFAIVEYFVGFFPPLTVPTLVFFVLLTLMTRLVRVLLERSFPMLVKNRTALYILLAVAVPVLLTLFSVGGLFPLILIGISVYQLRKRRRKGPRSLDAPGDFTAAWERMRRSLRALGPLSLLIVGTAVALVSSGILAGVATGVAAAVTYRPQVSLVRAKVTTMLPPIQVGDVPIVERSSAQTVMSNAIGTLGPQYHISQRGLSLVRFKGQLVWAAPLDYNNGLIWLTKRSAPGYVWMPANNPSARPSLVLNQPYIITPQAGFSFNLSRVLYQHFPTFLIGTSDWELAPNGNGYWVTSLYTPAPGLSALVTRVLVGCALTNPATGHVAYYKLGSQPSWVSQVVGPNFAQSEAARFGWDRSGFIASTFTHLNATQPVHATPYNVLLGNGGLGWEIPMTSPNSTDNSLSGVILVDAETNAVTYTPFTGMQNDVAIAQRINGATINSTLTSGRALLYNISGVLAYIAPVVNQTGIVQQVAIVDPKNVAQPIIASTMISALANWQSYLAGNGVAAGSGSFALQTVTGRVQRVATYLASSGASGATVNEYWLYLINGVAYRANLSLAPDVVPFIKTGDLVTVRFLKGSSSPITLESIADSTLSATSPKGG